MLKPMGKKTTGLALPGPPAGGDWPAGAMGAQVAASATSAARPAYNAAALRIQLRYLKYQAKVRALLKKSDRLSDAQQQQQQEGGGSVSAQAKAAVRDRAVTGSSVALVAAFKKRKDGGDTSDQTANPQIGAATIAKSQQGKQPPVLPCAAPDLRVGGPWTSPHWTLTVDPKAIEQLVVDRSDEADDEDGSGLEDGMISTIETVDGSEMQTWTQEELMDRPDELVPRRRPNGFVNVMRSSWLLSSIEQRCRQRGGDLPIGVHRSIAQLVDPRLLVLDLIFIARSGVDVNLLGRAPSSVAEHKQRLLTHVSQRVMAREGRELSNDEVNRVARIFSSLQSDMVLPAVRALGWLLTKTWRQLFHGLHVDIDSLHRVRDTLRSAEGDVSVVFTPTHKSHLDYLIISYLCFAYGIPLPRIAAGNNLDLPLVGSFLRANGSFFIRRSFRNDHLYKHVLEQYVHELLGDGNPVEVFIEGGRSRHGRVCKPRLGFLSMFLDYVRAPAEGGESVDASGKPKTIMLVPISLDYDKVYEAQEYANQLLGKPKEKESLKVFFQSVWDLFFLHCGHSYVRFGEPVAVTADSSLGDIAHTIATRMQTAGTVTATAIVSALLMWKRTYLTREMLDARAAWLVGELEKRGATVAHDEDGDLVDHALSILNVKAASNGVVSPQVEYPVRALELGFYRNHVLHVFLPEMAIVGAIDCLLRQVLSSDNEAPAVTLEWARVVVKARTMWRYLRHICRHDDLDVEEQLEQFLAASRECEQVSDPTKRSVVVDVRRWQSSKLVGLLLSLHWSFADSLWLSTLALWSLTTSSTPPSDRDFVRRVQTLAKELFVRKELRHAEALCGETIKQTVDFLVESDVICHERSDDGTTRVLRLASDEMVDEVIERWTCEVNSWRQPREFLWRPHAPAADVERDDACGYMSAAVSGASVYAEWMALP